MKEPTTRKMYDLWAWFYDYTFGACVRARQLRATQQLHLKPGDLVLDLGVGTGMTLRHYPKNVTIVGVDLSDGMLAKAAGKCRDLGMDHCRLICGDAMHPPFAEQSFDHIMITHVISVVSDPARLIAHATRLLKPNGRIVLLNHFQSTNPVMAWLERVFNPMFIKIGWRSDLPLDECLRGVDLRVEYRFKMSVIDLWQIVVLTHPCAEAAVAPTQPLVPEVPATGMGRRLAVEGH
ncbi:MAG: methyltransferase domain-containing protein [Planctomycetes bacterium]|nr:methyltransferase domain-containing protein [Planctomycetota bacterium]